MLTECMVRKQQLNNVHITQVSVSSHFEFSGLHTDHDQEGAKLSPSCVYRAIPDHLAPIPSIS